MHPHKGDIGQQVFYLVTHIQYDVKLDIFSTVDHMGGWSAHIRVHRIPGESLGRAVVALYVIDSPAVGPRSLVGQRRGRCGGRRRGRIVRNRRKRRGLTGKPENQAVLWELRALVLIGQQRLREGQMIVVGVLLLR